MTKKQIQELEDFIGDWCQDIFLLRKLAKTLPAGRKRLSKAIKNGEFDAASQYECIFYHLTGKMQRRPRHIGDDMGMQMESLYSRLEMDLADRDFWLQEAFAKWLIGELDTQIFPTVFSIRLKNRHLVDNIKRKSPRTYGAVATALLESGLFPGTYFFGMSYQGATIQKHNTSHLESSSWIKYTCERVDYYENGPLMSLERKALSKKKITEEERIFTFSKQTI